MPQLLQHCTLSVMMVIYNLWVEILHWKEDWKFASTMPGGQCAIIYLEIMMQLQLVISLDLKELVSIGSVPKSLYNIHDTSL